MLYRGIPGDGITDCKLSTGIFGRSYKKLPAVDIVSSLTPAIRSAPLQPQQHPTGAERNISPDGMLCQVGNSPVVHPKHVKHLTKPRTLHKVSRIPHEVPIPKQRLVIW